MQDVSARLSLPYIMPSQAQKHVTHNEGLAQLDVLVQLVVETFGATTPPLVLSDGQIWALGPAPTGDWAGMANHLAAWQNGGWIFLEPQIGWRAVVRDDLSLRIWTGTTWARPDPVDLTRLEGVGIGTDYDAVNALSVAAPASLLSHAGAGHQLKINKAASAETASLLFQTSWSGRAEMGTTGSDNFEVKVSADGSTWFTGLRVDAGSGRLGVPEGMQVTGQITGTAVMQSPTDNGAGRLMTTGAFGLGAVIPPFLDNLDSGTPPNGTYHTSPSTAGTFPSPQKFGQIQILRRSGADAVQMFWDVVNDVMYQRRYRAATGGWQPWRSFLDSGNTTVDSNGFIKSASPIVRLAQTGIEEPVEPVGAVFAREGVGHYTLSDVAPLATSGWQIEVPQDHNGNRLVFVTTSYNTARRVLTIKTETVTWDSAKSLWVGGTAIDIPEGRWVDLRLFKPVEDTATADG